MRQRKRKQSSRQDPLPPMETEKDRSLSDDSSLKRHSTMFVRRPGETTRSYLERVDMETKMKVAESLRKVRQSDRKSNRKKRLNFYSSTAKIDPRTLY